MNPFDKFVQDNIAKAEEEKRRKQEQINQQAANNQYNWGMNQTFATQSQSAAKPKMAPVRKISDTEYEIII